MERCECGRLAYRHHWGRFPVNLRVWLFALWYERVYECYCGRVWAA